MWSRFIPIMVKLRQLLAVNAIGNIHHLQSNFGFRADQDPSKRWLNPELGGGALLDVGIYPIGLASMLFGKPQKIVSSAVMHASGVDQSSGYVLQYANGAMASLSATVMAETSLDSWIIGESGKIHLPNPWWMGEEIHLYQGETKTVINTPKRGRGYGYQATAVMQDLDAGATQSSIMPLQESLDIMQTMDNIRAQWGLVYPQEK